MNLREELLKLEDDEVVDYLNNYYRENSETIFDLFDEIDKDEFRDLCNECNGMTYLNRGKPFCDVHKNVDGNTYNIKVLYALDVAVAYNTNTKQWIRYYDDMGED